MGELSGLHLKITGDSVEAVKAAIKLQGALNRMDGDFDKINRKMRTFGPTFNTSTREAMSGLSGMNKEMRTARFHSANLFAQFQDIGVMIASGQSPFILAAQQGSQVSQVMMAIGGTGREQFAALRAAAMSFISPLNILTIGIIAGVAALGQWALNADWAAGATKTLSDTVDELEGMVESAERRNKFLTTSVEELQEEFGTATQVLQGFNKVLLELELDQIRSRLRETTGALEEFAEQGRALASSPDLDVYIARLMNIYDLHDQGEGAALQLLSAMEDLSEANTLEDQALAAKALYEEFLKVGVSIENIPDALKTALGDMEALLSLTARYEQLLAGMNFAPFTNSMDNMTGAELLPSEEELTGRKTKKGPKDKFPDEFESLEEFLMTETELELKAFEERQAILEEALDRRMITKAEHLEMMEKLEEKHQDKLAELDVWQYGNRAQKAGAFMGEMEDIFASGNSRMLEISKKFGAAQALVSAWQGAAEALKLPFPQNMFAFAKVLSTGLAAVEAIKGVGPGGTGATSVGGAGGAGTTAAPAPLQAVLNLQGPFAQALQDEIGPLFDRLRDEAGDRGYVLATRVA